MSQSHFGYLELEKIYPAFTNSVKTMYIDINMQLNMFQLEIN